MALPVNAFWGRFSHDVGIDLGTANTLVYVAGRGIVIREPSFLARGRKSKEILAIGLSAKKMYGKTPRAIEIVRPLKSGVIADFDAAYAMLSHYIKKVHASDSLIPKIPRPKVVLGVPSGITEVERRAVVDAAKAAGARAVYLVEEPMAAAIGAGLPVMEPSGSMIVDIGGGTTEVAVISLGGMVVAKSGDVAGDEMDDCIVQYFRRKHNLVIGETTAEEVKIQIGSVFPLKEEKTIEVKGRDQAKGLPKTILVTSEEIRQALMEPVQLIVDVIKQVLEATPPELSADLVDRGMVLAGGGSLLRGFPELIRQETELPVHRAADPLSCVALGCGKYLEELDKIQRPEFLNSYRS